MELEKMANTISQVNLKLVLLGDGTVGKTSLVNYFLKKNFLKRYIPTIGSIILKKEYKLDDNIQIKVNIWDVGGQKSFNPLNPSFYTNVDAAFLVFDLCKPKETLANIKNNFLKNLEKYAKDCQTIVIGNKLDLISLEKDLQKIIKKYFSDNIPLIITSARTGQNVVDSFELLIYHFLLDWEVNNPYDKGIAQKFLNYIGKEVDDLMNKLLNLENIETLKLQKPPQQEVKTATEDEVKSLKNETLVLPEKEEKIIDKYIPIQQEIKQIETFKDDVIKEFNKNLNEVEKLILNLKKTPIDSLLDLIDKTKDQIERIKRKFKTNLQSLLKLE